MSNVSDDGTNLLRHSMRFYVICIAFIGAAQYNSRLNDVRVHPQGHDSPSCTLAEMVRHKSHIGLRCVHGIPEPHSVHRECSDSFFKFNQTVS